ncbi:MAG TPA: hypothetical protein VH413_15675 [Verrucomicrobiae bacterium]|jgi:hypothetical protein|nr:hypothetical protein [Verrucomicrobiae bacterium]
MSDLQLIEQTLQAAARRRRRERALRGLWQGLLVGGLIFFVTLGIYKLAPIPSWVVTAAGIAGGVAAVVGCIIGGWRKTTVEQMARWVDGRQQLQERLSTALEMAKGPGSETWRTLLVTDAAAHAKELDARRLVPFTLPQVSRWALVVLALAAGLGFVPEYRSKTFVAKVADQKNIQDTGKELTELTKRNLQKRPPAMETTQKAMETVSELGQQLSKQKLTRSDALKQIANVTDRIKDEMKDAAKEPAIQRMEQAARSPGGENSPDAARLQKQIEQTQKQLGTPNGSPEDMDKLNKELNKIQEAAKAAADKNGGMSQADKEKISKSMAALSKQAQQMGMQMPNMDQAIQALAANQTDMFLKDLQAETQDLEKTKDLAKSLQQMQQQMEKMGKDLAEQLKNGQPEAAQDTLKKMQDQLKSANLTPEQMQKMVSEVAKAVSPGSQYGKVGEKLNQAAKAMQSGNKPGAGQSLAEASKELDKLMQQMNDAQAMESELDGLNRAQMAISTGQSWGQCNKPGVGTKPGGKPGSGVGTWANEDAGWGYDGHQTQRWDNTGITRPDQKPRGVSDRGDGELNDALKPTKVKGQFSPGGQMPSITLKGVSIKGTSSVAYEEAAVAAQADAQSALSQEKVPRAYQGAVRDYFDDMKK